MSLRKPVRMVGRVKATEPDAGVSTGERLSLPVRPEMPVRMVQRQPADVSARPSKDSLQVEEGQGAAEQSPEMAEAEGETLNLDDLARQIYPFVKRMLAVERERRANLF